VKLYGVFEVYDPGAGEYSEQLISLHYNKKNAEDKATEFLIIEEENHLASCNRLEKAGYKRPDYPNYFEFYGDGGGKWGSHSWKVRELEIDE